MTAEEIQAERFGFKAEIRQVLHILVHSLYQDKEIFLREMVSNASDALTRLHFEQLTNANILDPDAELAIHISIEGEEDQKFLVIEDSGIGMNREELIQNLGTIAQSGAREFLASMEKVDEAEVSLADVIGQFGVGFYSVFMVGDRVEVISRSFRPEDEAARWVSDGGETFEVLPAEKEKRGTTIRVHLRSDAQDFTDPFQLRQIIKKHSDFVNYPIYVEGEQANQRTSLWRQQPSQVDQEAYDKFYQQLTMDFEEPAITVHMHADAPVNIRALLFIPSKRERLFSTRTEPGVKLYSRNVLIQEYCTDLLPKWLEFVDGVVDSEDLPLNVSRETVQNNRLMRHLGETLKKRILRELRKLADKEPEKYQKFWQEFGRVLKEGLALDPTAKEELTPLFHYRSSAMENQLTSLDAYIERMPDDQDAIYYVTGDSASSVANSPHLDPFKAREIEVLYWIDPLDAFLVPIVTEYQGKTLRNIDDPELELPELDQSAEEGDDVPSEALSEAEFNRFVGKCVTTLGEKVTEVRASRVLTNSPVRLVSPADAPAKDMQRIQRFLNQNYEVPKKILELNRDHALIAQLARKLTEQPDTPLVPLAIEQLYEGALLQEGLHPNPADMVPRMQKLLELAAS